MKTVKEWFETIKDEDVRRRALANCSSRYLYREDPTLADAIRRNFTWSYTSEGFDYWNEQYEKALNNEL